MEKPISPEEFEKCMKDLRSGDVEEAHCKMDDLMCELLIALGYEAGVKIFEKQDKWYA